MTREEIIDGLKAVRTIHNGNYAPQIDEAIKLLEQEPILDKIRDEIEALPNANPSYWHSGDMVEREEVFEIIDKYRGESKDASSD